MTALARLGDQSTGDPCGAPPRPSSSGASTVFANTKKVHRVGDAWEQHACPGSPPHPGVTASGSPNVFAEKAQVARVDDSISCGSSIAKGSPNVIVNESFITVAGVTLPSNQNSFKNAESLIGDLGYSAIDDEFEVNSGGSVYPPLPQTMEPPPIPPKEVEIEDDEPQPEPPPPEPTDCEMITNIDYDQYLSPHFRLRELSISCVFPHTIKAQNGLTQAQIICNLKALCENVLEPIRAHTGVFRINSGFRTLQNSKSQHSNGQAVDIQFPGKSYDEVFAIAQWVKDNINFDQEIFEHGNAPWLHISFNRAGNRPKDAPNAVMTMYKNKYSPGLKKIAGYK